MLLVYVDQALLAYRAKSIGAMSRREMEEEFRAVWQIISGRRELVLELLDQESHPPDFQRAFRKIGAMLHSKEKLNG